MAGREVGVRDSPLLSGHAPVAAGPLEPVPIVEDLARRVAQADEIDLDLVVIGREVPESDVAFTQCRYGLRGIPDAESAEQGPRRLQRLVRRRHVARHTFGRRQPQRAGTVAEGRGDLAWRQ